MARLLLLLFTLAFASPAAADCAKKDGPCEERYAPGMLGSMMTMETLHFLGGSKRVHFPGHIDPPQTGGSDVWTDFYFSSAAGGVMGNGANANDGLSMETPKEDIGEALVVGFGGQYRRLNFDCGDTWATGAGNGWDQQLGIIADAQITPGSCPSDVMGALAQPCFWWRSTPGCTTRAHFDSSGTPITGVFAQFAPVADRSHWLIEDIDFTCDSSDASPSCWDTDGTGIMTVVGQVDGVVSADVSGSTQIIAAHDVSITHIYGASASYSSGLGTGTNSLVGTNFSGTVAIHTSGLLDAPTTTAGTETTPVVDVAQALGSMSATLDAEATATPAYVLVTGAHMRTPVTTASSAVVRVIPDDTAPRSGHAEAHLISVLLDHRSTHANPVYLNIQDLDNNASTPNTARLTAFYPTFDINAGASFLVHVISGTMDASDTVNIRLGGCMMRKQGAGSLQPIRIGDFSFADDSTTSSIDVRDCLYESTADIWRIFSEDAKSASGNCPLAGGNCFCSTPALLQTCVDLVTNAATINVDNNNQSAAEPVGNWTVTGGYCDNDQDGNGITDNSEACRAMVDDGSSSQADYTLAISPRAACQKFMCGRIGDGIMVDPAVVNDAGRQRGAPWSEL